MKILSRTALSLFIFILQIQDVTGSISVFFSASTINTFFGSGTSAINAFSTIDTVVTATAYSVLAIGFVLGLYSLAVKSDTVQAQGVLIPLKFFFRVMIIKILVDSVQPLFVMIVKAFGNFSSTFIGTGTAGGNSQETEALIQRVYANGEFNDKVLSNFNKEIKLGAIVLIMLFLLASAYMIVIGIMIGYYLLGVLFDCVLYYFASPIAVATLAGDEWSHVGKNYLKTIIAIGLNLMLIAFAVKLGIWIFQNAFNTNNSGTGIGAMFQNYVMSPNDYITILEQDDVSQAVANSGHHSLFTMSIKVCVQMFLLGTLILTLIKKAKQVANNATGGNF